MQENSSSFHPAGQYDDFMTRAPTLLQELEADPENGRTLCLSDPRMLISRTCSEVLEKIPERVTVKKFVVIVRLELDCEKALKDQPLRQESLQSLRRQLIETEGMGFQGSRGLQTLRDLVGFFHPKADFEVIDKTWQPSRHPPRFPEGKDYLLRSTSENPWPRRSVVTRVNKLHQPISEEDQNNDDGTLIFEFSNGQKFTLRAEPSCSDMAWLEFDNSDVSIIQNALVGWEIEGVRELNYVEGQDDHLAKGPDEFDSNHRMRFSLIKRNFDDHVEESGHFDFWMRDSSNGYYDAILRWQEIHPPQSPTPDKFLSFIQKKPVLLFQTHLSSFEKKFLFEDQIKFNNEDNL